MRELLSTRHFIWPHAPKTGGTWLHRILVEHSPASWALVGKLPSHVRLSEVPEFLRVQGVPERRGLPVVATMRNPWDWYVSLYFWMEGHYVHRTGGFSVPRDAWDSACTCWARELSAGLTIDGFRKALPSLVTRPPALVPVASHQEGFLLDADGRIGVNVVRFESLRDSFRSVLSSFCSLPASMEHALATSAPENPSNHPAYADCYTDDTRRLVAEKHGALIEAGKYEFLGR